MKERQGRQALRVRVPGGQLLMELRYVERVFLLMAVAPVPQAPACMVGLMDYQGAGVPVLDLGLWLGMSGVRPYTLSTPVILCAGEHVRVALVVEEVLGVDALAEETRIPAAGPALSALYQGIHRLPSGAALLLDMAAVLASDGPAAEAQRHARR